MKLHICSLLFKIYCSFKMCGGNKNIEYKNKLWYLPIASLSD
jgi:hypothetical protein